VLVSLCAPVDQQSCGKVDNSSHASLAQAGGFPIHKQREVSTVQPVSSAIRVTDMLADLRLFRRISGSTAVHRSSADQAIRWVRPLGIHGHRRSAGGRAVRE
jgi:hypothetical protein